MDTFNSFLWLPEENPANTIYISSDEEDSPEPDNTSLQILETKTVAKAPELLEAAKKHSLEFREFVKAAVPVHLLDNSLRNRIQEVANIRLNAAVDLGTTLDAVFIGGDCLPSWPGRVWDPQVESLHDAIQTRLMEHQDAQELGATLRSIIVTLGNKRLNEAIALRLDLADLKIGDDLLPTWSGREYLGNLISDDTSSDNNTIMDMNESVHSEESLLSAEDAAEETTTAAPEPQLKSAWSSDTDSDTDSHVSKTEMDYDDEISLFNFVSQQPVVQEPDEDTPLRNIVHDVDVHGAAAHSQSLDFEVYLAQLDDDVADLPEIELAIDDEDAFLHHHQHLADAVEIELDDTDIFCVMPKVDKSGNEEEDDANSTAAVPGCTVETTADEDSDEPITPMTDESGVFRADVPEEWVVV